MVLKDRILNCRRGVVLGVQAFAPAVIHLLAIIGGYFASLR